MAAALLGDTLLTHGGKAPTAEVLAGADYVAIYFSAHWCPPCRGFTPRLNEWVGSHASGLKLKVVFSTADNSEGEFKGYWGGEMKNLHGAIPYEQSGVREALDRKFKVQGIPTLIVLDAHTGELVCEDARSGVVEEPEGFPWKPKSLWEILEGVGSVVNAAGESVTVASLREKEYLGIYFSAHWCPPCRGFTPKLAQWYKALKARADAPSFELVFVSSDKSAAEFQGYLAEMPWYALPFADRAAKAALSKKFDVQGIPHFVIVDGSGAVAVKDGRPKVMGDLEAAKFPYPAQPFDRLDEASDFINETATLIAFTDKLTDAAAADAVASALEECGRGFMTDGKPSEDIRFALGTEEDEMAENVRGFLGLTRDKDGADAVRVVIVDIPQQRKAILGSGKGVPTAAQLKEFADAYLAGSAQTLGIKETPK